MTAHELGKLLLQGPDVPVCYFLDRDIAEINDATLWPNRLYYSKPGNEPPKEGSVITITHF